MTYQEWESKARSAADELDRELAKKGQEDWDLIRKLRHTWRVLMKIDARALEGYER
jgi:hypothetical protein